MPCQGCIDLDNGTGGENQLAHMDTGGCLYLEEQDMESKWYPVLDLLTTLQIEKIKKNLESKFLDKNVLSYRSEFEISYRNADLFIKECQAHNYKKMRQFLREGYNIDSRVGLNPEYSNDSHFSALHCAVVENDAELVSWLIQYGASFSVESYYKCGYVDEFIDRDEIEQIWENSTRINYCTRSFDSFKYCLDNGKILLDKRIFSNSNFISEEEYDNSTFMELLEQVFDYVKEDYKMGAYFSKKYNLDIEFQKIREFLFKKKIY